MSWSLNLYGTTKIVEREIADAILLLDRALDYVQNSDAPSVSVSLSGYVSYAEPDAMISSSSVSFNFGETYPTPSPAVSYPATEAEDVQSA